MIVYTIRRNVETKKYDIVCFDGETHRPDFPSLASAAAWAEENGFILALVAGVGFTVKSV